MNTLKSAERLQRLDEGFISLSKWLLKFLSVFNTVFLAATIAYELLCLLLIFFPISSHHFLLWLYEWTDYSALVVVGPLFMGICCRFFIINALIRGNLNSKPFFFFYAFVGSVIFIISVATLPFATTRAYLAIFMFSFIAYIILFLIYALTRVAVRFFIKDVKRLEGTAVPQLFTKHFFVLLPLFFLWFAIVSVTYPGNAKEMQVRQAKAAEVLRNIEFNDIQEKLDSGTAFSFEEWRRVLSGADSVSVLEKNKDLESFTQHRFFYDPLKGYKSRQQAFPKCGVIEAWDKYLAANVATYGVYKKRIFQHGIQRGRVQKGGVIFHKPDGVSFYVAVFWGDPVFTCVGNR